ncbi:MAG: inositol 2-dehydrogenase [Proteobacteria bacterium]|nr:inositol 2-dehydrogenase [Pseudomonadota bacterium]
MTRKRVTVVGAGRMGVIHARNVVVHPDLVLHCVADVRAEAAGAAAEPYGVSHTADIAAAIDDSAVDAVIIASSTDTHVDLIVRAARAGKGILCEKPIDLDLGRVDTCLAEVAKTDVPLQIGFNRRFDPNFAALRQRMRGGDIGTIELVKITSRDPHPPPLEYIAVSGGLFRDMMIHDFDMARWLLGDEPVSVHATASCLVDPAIAQAGDVDTAVVTMRTAKGVICTIENSRRAVYGYDQRIEVLGSQGMLQAGNPLPTTVTRSSADALSTDTLLDFFVERYQAAYRAELDHFARVLVGDTGPDASAQDGRCALVLAEAALSSLRSQKTVEVEW